MSEPVDHSTDADNSLQNPFMQIEDENSSSSKQESHHDLDSDYQLEAEVDEARAEQTPIIEKEIMAEKPKRVVQNTDKEKVQIFFEEEPPSPLALNR